MYICMYMCIYIHTHIDMCTYVCVYIFLYIYEVIANVQLCLMNFKFDSVFSLSTLNTAGQLVCHALHGDTEKT